MLSQSRSMLALGQADSLKGPASAYFDSSIVMAREALTYDSTTHGAHGQLARAYDKKGMLDSAAVHGEIEVRMSPDDRTEFTRLISIYQRQKKQAELVRLLEPMMTDSANFNRFGLILVNAYSETNDLAKAKALVQQVIAKDPSNCNAHQTYAYILLKREQYGQAIPVLQAGVKACPSDGDMWVQLGDCYYFSNQKSKSAVTSARDAYSRACSLGSHDGCEKKEQVEAILARPGLQ
jgi:tetratricopeptide (TPR) repeat protein